ncbi:outer membrane lipid asymmetry maintenance protein MlaD [Algicella marina]|uniref:Outer membrane lipid asymmetry maintenance protein MlaD n=1 Tax=Algicella marina TaxID=2683284 RepID=A0A6P1SYS8_9RHOB|nr:outer membrane lipid asymmetry maintenance protein MlaD [Algicella marina]QHQ34685.1 outer membrane lipid asymmetry maintenance protein MlaD [Algicella marina]
MANSATETLIGAVVLVTAVGFVAYASQTAGIGRGTSGNYELLANFNSAEGISVGTDVRMAGVKVGTVKSLGLNTETYQAETVFNIDETYKIPDDSDVKIASEGLLGGSFVEIAPGASEFMFADGDEILYTQSSVSLLALMMKFVGESASE